MGGSSDALKILEQVTGEDPALRALIDQETLNARVAQLIYDARTRAGLTQRDLAEMVGTQQPNIARLEDADYGGHTLTMLGRIASALGMRLEISLEPRTEDRKAS